MKVTLKQQLEAFERGQYLDSDGKVDSSCFVFYDWFCQDTSLQRKSTKLFSKVKRFVKANPELDTEKVYVFFKNNCPMVGRLYDDFRICNIESGDVQYTVVPKCSHSKKAEIWGHTPEGKFGMLNTADTYTKLFAK
jgi:hypothetical protein